VAAEGGQSAEEDGQKDETAEWGGLALKVKKWYKLVGPKRTVKPTKFDDVLSVHVVQARQLPAMDKSGTVHHTLCPIHYMILIKRCRCRY
jgi:hypothetical protein